MNEDGEITDISTNKAIGMEMKTNRGYFSKKEVYGIGNKRYPTGHPKMDHVMQTALYLRMRWKLEEYYGVEIDSFRIVYCQVDDGLTTYSGQKGIAMTFDLDESVMVCGACMMKKNKYS